MLGRPQPARGGGSSSEAGHQQGWAREPADTGLAPPLHSSASWLGLHGSLMASCGLTAAAGKGQGNPETKDDPCAPEQLAAAAECGQVPAPAGCGLRGGYRAGVAQQAFSSGTGSKKSENREGFGTRLQRPLGSSALRRSGVRSSGKMKWWADITRQGGRQPTRPPSASDTTTPCWRAFRAKVAFRGWQEWDGMQWQPLHHPRAGRTRHEAVVLALAQLGGLSLFFAPYVTLAAHNTWYIDTHSSAGHSCRRSAAYSAPPSVHHHHAAAAREESKGQSRQLGRSRTRRPRMAASPQRDCSPTGASCGWGASAAPPPPPSCRCCPSPGAAPQRVLQGQKGMQEG